MLGAYPPSLPKLPSPFMPGPPYLDLLSLRFTTSFPLSFATPVPYLGVLPFLRYSLSFVSLSFRIPREVALQVSVYPSVFRLSPSRTVTFPLPTGLCVETRHFPISCSPFPSSWPTPSDFRFIRIPYAASSPIDYSYSIFPYSLSTPGLRQAPVLGFLRSVLGFDPCPHGQKTPRTRFRLRLHVSLRQPDRTLYLPHPDQNRSSVSEEDAQVPINLGP